MMPNRRKPKSFLDLQRESEERLMGVNNLMDTDNFGSIDPLSRLNNQSYLNSKVSKIGSMPKITEAGTPTGGASPQAAIPFAAIGDLGKSVIDFTNRPDKYGVQNDTAAFAGSALSGAGQGAALGTAILPGIGTAVGAIGGAVIGGISGKEANEEAKTQRVSTMQQEASADQNLNSKKLLGYDFTGSNQNNINARYGGNVNKMYFNGGELKPLSSDSVEVDGASHEEGGVDLGQGAEVEGDETIKDINSDAPFVFSEQLGFAQRHRPIAKAIGKMEAKVPNNITKQTIAFLQSKEEALEMEQEELKNTLGLSQVNYALGGYMKRPKRNYY